MNPTQLMNKCEKCGETIFNNRDPRKTMHDDCARRGNYGKAMQPAESLPKCRICNRCIFGNSASQRTTHELCRRAATTGLPPPYGSAVHRYIFGNSGPPPRVPAAQ